MKKLPAGEKTQKLIGDGKIERFDDNLLTELAELLNQKKGDIIEDCYLYEIKKFMERIGQVNVRFDLPENKLFKLLYNASQMNMSEVLLPPVYLASSKKITIAERLSKKYAVVIDFPFGESAFSTKKFAVKDSIKQDVKSITVTLPTVLVTNENMKEFKKQTKKIGVMADVPIGVLFNASDMTDEQIKEAIKKVEKTRIDFITFAFGDATPEFIRQRMNLIKKYSGKIRINVLGNIDRADIVKDLIKLGINIIYTPYADDIAKEIIDVFGIKMIKLA